MEHTKSLQRRVDEALDAAVFENEYVELMTRGVGEVTTELLTYSPGMEDEDEAEVHACVQNYATWYRSGNANGPRQQ